MARGFRRCLAGPVLCLLTLATIGALPAAAASTGGARYGPKVIGGHDASPGQFPWVAALALHSDPRDYEAQFCGGTVIAPLWILTASHCVIGDYFVDEDEHGHQTVKVEVMPARDLDVIVGKTDLLSPGGERHRAAEIVLHPAASLRFIGDDILVPVNDLALVRLRTPTTVTPVPLARAGQQALYAPHVSAEVVGWGSIVDPGGKTPPSYPAKLQHAAIPIVSDAECSAPNVHGAGYLRSSMLCAGAPLIGTPGRGACFGDSGGPLVVQNAGHNGWVQAGIVSWGGATCTSSGQPGVFARVAALSDFVRATIGFGPFAGAARFVQGQYRDFAFRKPTKAELSRWVAHLSSGTAPQTLVTALDRGPTWQRDAGTVDRLYRAAFNRQVNDRAMGYWIGRLRTGWTAAQVASVLAAAPEFVTRYGALDNPGFVHRMYENVLGRTGDADGVAYWVGRLHAGLTRGHLMTAFAASPRGRDRVAAVSHVVTTWYGMLRHVPTAPDVAHWASRPNAELIDMLLADSRYSSRI